MPLICMREKVPLEQDESVRVFTCVAGQKKHFPERRFPRGCCYMQAASVQKPGHNRQFKLLGLFLYNRNTGFRWVKKQIFLTSRKSIEMPQNIINSYKKSDVKHVNVPTKTG